MSPVLATQNTQDLVWYSISYLGSFRIILCATRQLRHISNAEEINVRSWATLSEHQILAVVVHDPILILSLSWFSVQHILNAERHKLLSDSLM